MELWKIIFLALAFTGGLAHTWPGLFAELIGTQIIPGITIQTLIGALTVALAAILAYQEYA